RRAPARPRLPPAEGPASTETGARSRQEHRAEAPAHRRAFDPQPIESRPEPLPRRVRAAPVNGTGLVPRSLVELGDPAPAEIVGGDAHVARRAEAQGRGRAGDEGI